MRWAIALLVCGCGRIGFEATGDAHTGGSGGSGSNGSNGSGSNGADAALPDAAATACSFAIPLTLGARVPANTCTGRDLIDACSGPGTQEVTFVFIAPVAGNYSFRAFDPGTNNVSNTTGRAVAGCQSTNNCAGISSTDMSQGQTMYLVVEASQAGGCAQIEFEVM